MGGGGGVAGTLVPAVVGAPGWYKPDRLGSGLMLEEMLGTKGNAKYSLPGFHCTTAHTPTCSELQIQATERAGGTERKSCVFGKISICLLYFREL